MVLRRQEDLSFSWQDTFHRNQSYFEGTVRVSTKSEGYMYLENSMATWVYLVSVKYLQGTFNIEPKR